MDKKCYIYEIKYLEDNKCMHSMNVFKHSSTPLLYGEYQIKHECPRMS